MNNMLLIYKILFAISFPIFLTTGLLVINPTLEHILITKDVAKVLMPMSFVFMVMVGLDYLIRYKGE